MPRRRGGSSAARAKCAAALAGVPAVVRGEFWEAPEIAHRHGSAAQLEAHPQAGSSSWDSAFPDLNCDRAERGRWRALRQDLELLVGRGFGQASPAAMLQWRPALERLKADHGLVSWLRPWAQEEWVRGEGVAGLAGNASVKLVCPLGIAAVVTVSLVAILAEAHADIASGRTSAALAALSGPYRDAADALQALVARTMAEPRVALSLLAAVRWPVLDLLAAVERQLHRVLHGFALREYAPQSAANASHDCVAGRAPSFARAVGLARSLAEKSLLVIGSPIQHPHSRWVTESEELVRVAMATESSALALQWFDLDSRCRPAIPLQAMVVGLACVEQQFVALSAPGGDPEACLRWADTLVGTVALTANFAADLLLMDHAGLPVFGLWLRFRHIATHRLDLPFASAADLASVLGARALSGARPLDAAWGEGLRAALPAFEALATRSAREPRRAAFLTMCWGEAHAARLQQWLRAVQRAGGGLHTVVMCFDLVALSACRAAHADPRLCSDARAWPASSLSKLLAVALCIARGVSVLWLDTDVVVMRDPLPFLEPSPGPDMLFSVEADSWNCINTGVFFVRATQAARRYIGYWISLLLERPVSSDQATLYLLLGLVPKMDYAGFVHREGLLAAASPRVRALGAFGTPPWGALDSRKRFTTTYEATYGGVEQNGTGDIAAFHMLESWPRESVPNPIYADLRHAGQDPVAEILQGLVGASPRARARALALVRRSQRDWIPIPGAPGGRRDCRSTYQHGR